MRFFGRSQVPPAESPSGNAVAPAGRDGHDAPVRDRAEDDLDRWRIAHAVHRVVATAPQGWSTRIGLYGPWGSGKTTILNFLEEIAEGAGSIVVRFSAWSASGESGIVAQFYDALADELKRRSIQVNWTGSAKRWMRGQTERARGFVDVEAAGKFAGAFVPGAGAATSALSALGSGLLRVDDQDLKRMRDAIGSRRVVVFIDDLDRADPRLVPKALLALRELLDWPDFAFVLAFDLEMVASALGEYSKAFGDTASRFLEKVIDVPFVIPEPDASNVVRLATRVLGTCCAFIPQSDRDAVAGFFPSNPRQAKLVARDIGRLKSAAERHDPGELNWQAIVLQTILRHASKSASSVVEDRLLGYQASMRRAFKDAKGAHGDQDPVNEAISEAEEGLDDPRRTWLRATITKLVSLRSLDSRAKWESEMRLVVAEPPLTKKEYRKTVADWIASGKSGAPISSAIDTGCVAAGVSRETAASALLEHSLQAYDDLLRRASDTTLRTDLQRLLGEAAEVLSYVEYLWRDSGDASIQAEARSLRLCCRLLGVARSWAHFVKNNEDRPLRERELALAKLALSKCADPLGAYFATEPKRTSHSAISEEMDRLREALFTEVRVLLEPAAISYALGCVEQPGGVMEVIDASGLDHGDRAWLLASDESPLLTVPNNEARLVALLGSTRSGLESRTLSTNAVLYLELILGETRAGSWTTDRTRLVANHSKLIAAAWSAAICLETQYRAVAHLQQLRGKLVEYGADVTVLSEPTWLAATGELLADGPGS